MKIRRAKRHPNVAKLSGYKGADVAAALGSKGLRRMSPDLSVIETEEINILLDMKVKDLNAYQRMILRNAGYVIPD